ncbi:MAG TPA: AbrB/MazE/SpoVT family DNA-binding domain-containing protein [Nitrospirales bacterium]|jgi:bifunctional DNA-binding transcriptional regulator/antitoxin component of YhaV-PrlF toxin-antitoxin module
MPNVTIRERGQLTIPISLRRELGLEEEATFTLVKVGQVLLLTPRRLVGDMIARKGAKLMKAKSLRLQDILGDLKKQRTRYNQERYGV